MSNVADTNLGGSEHASHLQLDEFGEVGEHRVLCSCGVIFTGIVDHSSHIQIDDFDAGLTICDCGTSWTFGVTNQ